jgi:hypothetical protein
MPMVAMLPTTVMSKTMTNIASLLAAGLILALSSFFGVLVGSLAAFLTGA